MKQEETVHSTALGEFALAGPSARRERASLGGGLVSSLRRLVGLAVLLAGCNAPEGATPVPEPPALDGTQFENTVVLGGDTDGERQIDVDGRPGTATPGADLLAINLDGSGPTTVTRVPADGSFKVSVLAADGDELRLQTQVGRLRSEAVDLIVHNSAGLAARHACVDFQPRTALDFFDGTNEVTLRVRSTCSGPVRLENARFRGGQASFATSAAFPLELSSGAQTELRFEYVQGAEADAEEVWFLDVSLEEGSIRYPFTFRGQR